MNKNLEANSCPQCGAPLKLSAHKCEYCGSEFMVTSLSYLDQFDRKGINKYLKYYKQLLESDAENGQVNCAIGICYLDLGLYGLAAKFFAKTIEQLPDYGDAYYYYALSLIGGRKPKVMTLTEIRKIEEYLNAAIQIDCSKSKYYYLWALVKYDFYMKNCLRMNSPTFEELIQEGSSRAYDRQEIKKIFERVPVKDEEITRILWR